MTFNDIVRIARVLHGLVWVSFAVVCFWGLTVRSFQLPDHTVLMVVAFIALIISAWIFGRLAWEIRRGRLWDDPTSQPWTWRSDWVRRIVRGKIKRPSVAWFLVLPMVIGGFIAVRIYPQREQFAQQLVVLLVAVVPSLLAYLFYVTFASRRFGDSYFQLFMLPFSPGERVLGSVHLRLPATTKDGIHLRLSCLHRTENPSENGEKWIDRVLWETETTLAEDKLIRSGDNVQVPVQFDLPSDAYETYEKDPRNRVLWTVQTWATLPGIDLNKSYEIPVFRIGRFSALAAEKTSGGFFQKGDVPQRAR